MFAVTLLYASRFGQTQAISEALAADLQQLGWQASCQNIQQQPEPPSEGMHLLLLPVFFGQPWQQAFDWLQAHQHQLNQPLLAMVSVSLSARKQAYREVTNNPFLAKMRASLELPVLFEAAIAGALELEHCSWWEKLMLKRILSFGRINPKLSAKLVFTDWQQVTQLAHDIDSGYRQMLANQSQLLQRGG